MQTPRPHSSGAWQWTKRRNVRTLFSWCRWLHVYFSTAMLSLLVFFCVTGIFLNHQDWFESEGELVEQRAELADDLIQTLRQEKIQAVPRLETFIATTWQLELPRKVDLDWEVGEIVFDFSLPAGYALVTIELETGMAFLEKQHGTIPVLLNDLHKGRHTGRQWAWVIDLSAVGMIVLAMTGFFILFQQAKWRLWGLIWTGLGCLVPLLVYWLWVPK